MESEVFSTPKEFVKCCDCGCSCSLISTSSDAWSRSVKRKYDEFEAGNRFYVPEIDIYFNAKVQIENECIALREMVCNQQQAIQDLHTELEEERNASSSAASEAMGMILRLQRDKAEIQMESRQFKRFAEEKMAHDQQEILVLEDLLYKREQAIHSLTCEVQAYKHRMMSYGLTEEEAEGGKGGYSGNLSIGGNSDTQFDIPAFDYPPLRCSTNEIPADDEVEDVEKYAFGETPRAQEQLRNLEFRIYQMERNPSSNQLNQLDGDVSRTKNIMEKVIVGHSPRRSKHLRRFSTDSLNSTMETPRSASDFDSPRFNTTFKRMENISEVEVKSFSRKMDTVSEYGDDMSDRVYTIDSVHNAVPYNGSTEPKAGVGICDDFVTTPTDSLNLPDIGDPDIMKLYMRLQALEADRESMRQAIISMRTDKAQLVLLKEIAQHLCKDMSPEKQKKPIKKPTLPGASTFMSVFKWVSSFVFWRKKAHRSKYMHGMSPNNVGLLMLLDKGFQTRQWRCISSAQV